MSLTYELRSDDEYSEKVSVAAVREFLIERLGVTGATPDFYRYEQGGCLIEVELVQGSQGSPGTIQSVGFRIPFGADLSSATRAAEIGIELGQRLGWRLFDDQQGAYIEARDLEPALPFREALRRLILNVRQEAPSAIAARLASRARKQSLRSIGEISFGALCFVFVVGTWLGLKPESRLLQSLGTILFITALLVTADVVLDVLGTIQQEAEGRREGTSGTTRKAP